MAKKNNTAKWKKAYASAAGLPSQFTAAIQGIMYAATAYKLKRSLLSSTAKVYLLCLVLSCSAFAQLPDAPSAVKKENPYLAPFKHAEFYVGVGTFAASEGYDIHSTKVCEHTNPPQCAEAYKGHDRYGYALPLIGLVAMGTYGCELMLTDHKWYRRFICPGLGIGMSYIHWKDGRQIYKNDLRAKP